MYVCVCVRGHACACAHVHMSEEEHVCMRDTCVFMCMCVKKSIVHVHVRACIEGQNACV